MPAGLPSWPELRDTLLKVAQEKTPTDKEPQQKTKHISLLKKATETRNLWTSFQILKNLVGKTTYRDTIRKELMRSDQLIPPETYQTIWKMRPAGVLNLNLDGFASRAFGIIFPGHSLNQFPGKQAASYTYLLKSPEPFIANLHGTIADESSWVFTHDELRHLLKNDGYRHFVATCLSAKTILFLGMSADDVSVSEHLKALAEFGVDAGSHFWLTHRIDSQTDKLAEKIGIRIIRYENKKSNHEEVRQFFDDLLNYVPQEIPAPPIAIPTAMVATTLPDASSLANLRADEIRQQLNSHVAHLLTKSGDDYSEIEQLIAKYDEAVYRAWYIGTTPPNNQLLGLKHKRLAVKTLLLKFCMKK
jgi:hypothetical protein